MVRDCFSEHTIVVWQETAVNALCLRVSQIKKVASFKTTGWQCACLILGIQHTSVFINWLNTNELIMDLIREDYSLWPSMIFQDLARVLVLSWRWVCERIGKRKCMKKFLPFVKYTFTIEWNRRKVLSTEVRQNPKPYWSCPVRLDFGIGFGEVDKIKHAPYLCSRPYIGS